MKFSAVYLKVIGQTSSSTFLFTTETIVTLFIYSREEQRSSINSTDS